MVKLIGQILLLFLAMTLTKAICEAIGNRALSKLATMATILIICVTVVKSEPVKQFQKTAADVGSILDKLANGKTVQYDSQKPTSFTNPLPDDQILWGPPKPKK